MQKYLLESVLSNCARIAFHISDERTTGSPMLILEVADAPTGELANTKLKEWANDSELIAALKNRQSLLDLSLIHSVTNQVAQVNNLAFEKRELDDFINKGSQSEQLDLLIRVKNVNDNSSDISYPKFSPVKLIRYIVIQ